MIQGERRKTFKVRGLRLEAIGAAVPQSERRKRFEARKMSNVKVQMPNEIQISKLKTQMTNEHKHERCWPSSVRSLRSAVFGRNDHGHEDVYESSKATGAQLDRAQRELYAFNQKIPVIQG
jgi:hypothetical protein